MSSTASEVRIATGLVSGTVSGNVAVFRGIPYAQPPVGELRFATPAPALPWEGVRDASAFGPPVPQSSPSGAVPTAPVGYPDQDEWLTVNVWSPDPRSDGLPVMVWIYGGAYRFGDGANPTYDGIRMAREGNVVLVTFNYRVAVEGFVQIEGAPANRGLLDQVAALRWVRENIAAFGGDPDQVTVFGQSAGGGSVASLLAMPEAAGLLQRAIVQSVPRTYLSPSLAEAIAAELAAVVGRRPTWTDFMELDPYQLVTAGDKITGQLAGYADRWGEIADTPSAYAPVVDGTVLPQNPWGALAAGASRDVPLIIGHTRNEYRLFIALAGNLGKITDAQADHALRIFAPDGEPNAYRAAYPRADDQDLYEVVNSDWLFRMPSLALAKAHVSAGGSSYLYELTYQVPGMGGLLGAPHGADVPLIFGNFQGGSADLPYGGDPPSAQTEALGETMRAAWTSFARTGDPGWPAFTTAELLTKVYDTEPAVLPYPEDASRRLWESEHLDTLDLVDSPSQTSTR